ncbi:ABC transporter ATP-binding protein [Mycobacterium tuberculosis]|nr:ABC transporter ATP-binding protein [Mycobacterium tuberculosis]
MSAPVLSTRDLTIRFGGHAAVDRVTADFHAGTLTAIVGPNGAGKTTLVNLVTGHLAPSGGRVLLAGEDVTLASPVARVRKGLVRTFQISRLFGEMTPEEHVTLALLQRRGRATRILERFGADSAVADEAAEILATLGLTETARIPVARIAYGQQRLLEIAFALALRPRVLLLDEPAAGVPSTDTPRIEAALERLPADLAVLMIEHDMDLVFRFARHVAVLAAGEVIFSGPPEAVAEDARVRTAYLGSYADARRSA